MNTSRTGRVAATTLATLFGLALGGQALAADATAAQALAKRSNCFKCHAIDKPKEAVSWKEVATQQKGKADAYDKLVKHITTGPKVKLEDGSQEEHPIIKTKNAEEIKNLVEWILSL